MKNLSVLKIPVFICLLFLLPRLAEAQIYINEFLASNTGIIVDPDYQESADWLEIYNAGNNTIDLGGYFLTDNFDDKSKWQIPVGTTIDAHGFLIIWADGYNTGLHTSFKISSSGEELAILNPSGAFIDSVSFGLQETNISMGRKPDGGQEWVYFPQPSPGTSNYTPDFEGVVKNKPLFTPLGGIFNSPVTVSVTNTFGGNIHYTLDGSEPNENSPILLDDIQVNETTVIRARILKPLQIPGKTVTHTYFINSDNSIGDLPVVSLVSAPENFWDAEKGIYVQDFKPDWEIPVNIELFENDGSDRAGFNQKAGVKVNGLYSWQLPQKMLGVYFRKEYGSGKLDYPLLFDEDRNVFDNFALRASGSDWAYTLFRDGMTQSLTEYNMDIDYQGFRAAVLYINGQYMGINNLRSKIDESFIVEKHHLGDQKIDMIENEDYVEAGSLDQYAEFEKLYHGDLEEESNYIAVAELMDIENFTDFIISEIYSQNTSVDHNIMAWKPKDGGKWKWILNDLDRGFFNAGSNLIDYYVGRDVIPFFNLLRNDNYKHYFGKRLADHLFTTYDPERVKSVIDKFKANIEKEVPKHIARWQGTGTDYGDPIPSVEYWENEVGKMKTFADNRPSALLNDLRNYGFQASQPLTVSIVPENAGKIEFNGLKIDGSRNRGAYPENEEITLIAHSKDGYIFAGWKKTGADYLVKKEQVWKYNDSGTEPDISWKTVEFNDSDWAEGEAELGYGDRNEKTVLSYGGDSGNKFITYYFRKTFQIEDTSAINNLNIQLKCDDGAVVYINGHEVIRENLPDGEITYATTALDAISGGAETNFTRYTISPESLHSGENLIAVEIHQVNATSSDISFDLELTAMNKTPDNFYTTSPEVTFTHVLDEEWTAVFESDGSCILPATIAGTMILNKDCSPYRVPESVTVTETGKLIVESGVELWFSDDVSLTVNGKLDVQGSKNDPVIFRSNPESRNKKWGILNFVNADTSYLKNIIIEDASKGSNPIREIAAVSVFHSVLKIDGAIIENVHNNPVLARYSDVTLKNSRLHSKITGDLINLKYGRGFIDSCEFVGNDMPDTDAIDFDDIQDGVIRNSIIREMHGFNSDAIDIGERARNVIIENMVVYSVTDKGVSAGQQSSASILNSFFVQCNLGAGLKDSSNVVIDHCTYYGNGTSVACFEKNEGDAGGNAKVTNSILSNTYDASYSADSKSNLKISYSASDNNVLPAGNNNWFVNPKFQNPNSFDFRLAAGSSLVSAGNPGNIGATLHHLPEISTVYISGIAYKSDLISDVNEFIELAVSGNSALDISGYSFTKGITFTFPEGSSIEPEEKVYVVFDASLDFWKGSTKKIFQWESGRLADEGESIQLETPEGIVVDYLVYNNSALWPDVSMGEGIALKADNLDNHFGENWASESLETLVSVSESVNSSFDIYPNPTTGEIHFSGLKSINSLVEIYNLNGTLILAKQINSNDAQLNISKLNDGIYIVRVNGESKRIVLLK